MRQRDLVQTPLRQPSDVVCDQLRSAGEDRLLATQRQVRILRTTTEATVHVAATADAQPLTTQPSEIARLKHRVAPFVDEEARVDEVQRLELRWSGVVRPVVVDRLSIDAIAEVGDRLVLETAAEQSLGKLNGGQLGVTADDVVDSVEVGHDLFGEP